MVETYISDLLNTCENHDTLRVLCEILACIHRMHNSSQIIVNNTADREESAGNDYLVCRILIQGVGNKFSSLERTVSSSHTLFHLQMF